MKKVLCMLLAVMCLFAAVSCGSSDGLLFSLSGEFTPTEIKTELTYSVTVKSESFDFTGHFDTKIEGNNSVFDFEYQRFADISKGEYEGRIKTVKGTITKRDGQISTDGETWESDAPTALNFNVNLAALKKGSYTVSEDKRSLTATLTGKMITNVLGAAVPTESVELTVTSNGTTVTGLNLTYTTIKGASVEILTSYSYNPIKLFAD